MVFAALPWERRAVSRALGARAVPIRPRTWTIRFAGGRSGVLVETGVGPVRAREAALAAPAAKAWLAVGCAGALVPWLRRGQGIVANEVVVLDAAGGVVERMGAAGAPLAETAARHGVRVLEGAIAGSPAVLATPEARAAVATASGALVVDMESGALAGIARERGVPFHVLRAVLDVADESLPFGPDLVDERTGSLRLGASIRALAPPARWPLAVRLVLGQRAATRTLRAMARVLADDGMPEPALAWRAATA